MTIIALFAAFLLTVSAHTERVFDSMEGYKAPLFTVAASTGETVSLEQMKGRYVILTFWESTNPESRINVNRFEAMASMLGKEKLSLLALNMDSKAKLFEQIKRVDNLSAGTHVNVSSDNREMLENLYHLKSGHNSYLIDPQGEIVAINPSNNVIENIVKGIAN